VLHSDIASQIRFDATGLVPVVVQDRASGAVLMMAWADAEAVANTIATRRGTYFSRSRNVQWVKGESSGSVQYVHQVKVDCDGDTLLYVVDQVGAACHNGTRSCFDTATLLEDEYA